MGFQNWTFPLALYGCIETFSRKMLFLKVWVSNSNPLITGNFFLTYLNDENILPNNMDRGTETGKIAAIQAFLRKSVEQELDDPIKTVIYGPSTSNKIDRWWRDLHERLEKYFKTQLTDLLTRMEYNPHDDDHRNMLAYVFIPVIQKECDKFVNVWNTHRIRKQKGVELPTGIPNHMYSLPEKYLGCHKGF